MGSADSVPSRQCLNDGTSDVAHVFIASDGREMRAGRVAFPLLLAVLLAYLMHPSVTIIALA